jgi:peptidoglycan/xylan/chitin deacetylase (PgdA/CDA1 family)
MKKTEVKILLAIATLFLVIVACAFASTANAAVTLNTQQPKPNTVIIALEDGWYDQYQNAVPILNQFGFKATFDVYTMGIDTGHTGTNLWMNWQNIDNLTNSGYDIESLTVEHLNLNTLSTSALKSELANSKEEFLIHGIQVGDLTLPYDTPTNGTVINAIGAAGYLTIRGNTALYNVVNDTAVKMPVNVYYPTNSTTPAYLTANLGGNVSILLYHHIDNDPKDSAAVSPATFAAQMKALKDNGYNVETFSQAFFNVTPYGSPLPTATPYSLFANVNFVGIAIVIGFVIVVAVVAVVLVLRKRRHSNGS